MSPDEPRFLGAPPKVEPPRRQTPVIPIHALAVSSGDRLLAAAQANGLVGFWVPALGIGEPLLCGVGHGGAVRALACRPRDEVGADGPYAVFASGGVDGTIWTWHLGAPSRNQGRRVHDGAVLGLAFTPDGERLLSVSEDRTLAIHAGDQVRRWPAHDGSALCVAVSPDGQRVVTGGDDGQARLWSLDGERLASVVVQARLPAVFGATFLPGGESVLLAAGGALVEWQPSTGAQRELLVALGRDRVYAVAVSADGARYACASGLRVGFGDPRARGFGAVPELRAGHDAVVQSVAFLGDGRVASADEAGVIHLWTPARGGAPVLRLHAAEEPAGA
jgi:WD40 repeat protein